MKPQTISLGKQKVVVDVRLNGRLLYEVIVDRIVWRKPNGDYFIKGSHGLHFTVTPEKVDPRWSFRFIDDAKDPTP